MKKVLKKILIIPFIIALILLLLEGELVKKYAIEDWEVDLSFPTEEIMSQWQSISCYTADGIQQYPGQWGYLTSGGNSYLRNAENTDNLTGFYNPYTNYEDIDVKINMGVINGESAGDDDYMGIMIRVSENQTNHTSSAYLFLIPGDPYSPTGWRHTDNKFYTLLNPVVGDEDKGMGKDDYGKYIQSIAGSGAGLYKITNSQFAMANVQLLQLASEKNMYWELGVDQDVEIKATGNKIEVWVTKAGGSRVKEIEYTDANPIKSGSYGFFACSQPGDSYNNIRGTATLAKYTVSFNGNGGTTIGNSSITAISTKTYSGVPTSATRTGYTFDGWYTEPTGGTKTDIANGATVNINRDTTVYAHWAPRNDTRYKVQHWKQNSYDNTNQAITNEYNTHYDSTHYTLAGTDTLTGTTDSKVTPNVNTYEGFTSPAKQELVINADGSSVLNYYYKRNEYNVSLTAGNGIQTVTGARKYLYGATVKISATPKAGYAWDRWTGDTINGTENTYTFVMPAHGVSETAFGKTVGYGITYLPNDADPTTAKAVMPENPTTYDIETETITLNNPTRTGYEFIGWTSDNSTVPMIIMTLNKGSIGNKTFTANWRARNDTHYKVQHWKQRIYENQDEEVREYYNTHYNEECYEIAEIDDLEGTSDTKVIPNIKNYLGFTSPEEQELLIDANGTSVLNYYYKRNEYNVELIAGNGIKETIGGRNYLFEDRVEISAETKPGYEWEKWTGDKITGRNLTYVFIMPANDIRETASAVAKEYQITYIANDDDPTTSKVVMANNPATYNPETEDFKIVNPIRTGYEFVGWVVENEEIPSETEEPTQEVTITKGTYGNLKLTANWEAKTNNQYTVQHWQQRIYKNDDEAKERANASIIDEDNYKLVDTENFNGTTGTIVKPETKEYEGFTAPAKQELLIKADGTAIINYYYTRNYYKLTVEKDENTSNVEGAGIYLYGEKVKINCISNYGYSFKEWQGDAEDKKQEDYIEMLASDKQIKAISQKNIHKVTVDLGDVEKYKMVEYDDVIDLEIPYRDGYEFLYFKTKDGEKIYDNKLRIDDKDYYIEAVYAEIPTISLPQTGEDNDALIIALYAILTVMSLGTAIFFIHKRK